MQMQFDFSETVGTEPDEAREVASAVIVGREEPGSPRHAAVAVTMPAGEYGKPSEQCIDPRLLGCDVDVIGAGLVVISHAEHHVSRSSRLGATDATAAEPFERL